MKRLVICCDGTWNKPDNAHITNIEKIARTVQSNPASSGDVQQLVLYIGGVGVGYKLDRLLGGAFGSGLFNNVMTGYRFLALNYQPGDEIFVFGFSRGAYTARSLVGMVGAVGLMTCNALIADKLPEAVARYQRKSPKGKPFGQSNEEFKRDYCHPSTPITFLGVFDTVGALGVPGWGPKDHQFHDINLSESVVCARQALAIDEGRMTFEPCLWDAPPSPDNPSRVKQVWFEGAHSDVGGGYAETGLSDTALLWMAGEASRQGLVFDQPLLQAYVNSGSSAVRHSSLKPMYRLLNRWNLMTHRRPAKSNVFQGTMRNVNAPLAGVEVSGSALDHFASAEADYRPANLETFCVARSEEELTAQRESVIALPEASKEVLERELTELGISLGVPRQRAPGETSDAAASADRG